MCLNLAALRYMFYTCIYCIVYISVLQGFESFRDCLRLPDKAMVAMKFETHDNIPSQSTG